MSQILSGLEVAVRWLARAIELLIKVLAGGMLLSFVVLGPSGLYLRAGQALPSPLAYASVLPALALVAVGLATVSTDRFREQSFPHINAVFGGLAGPILFSALLLTSAAAVLAVFTNEMYEDDLVQLSVSGAEEVNADTLWNTYMWHFFDAMPLIDIPQRMNWSQPVTYSGSWVGLLVIGFQALGILILIPTIRDFFEMKESDRGPPDDGRRSGRQ